MDNVRIQYGFMGNRFFLLLLIIVSTLILSGCDNAQKAGTNYLAQQMRDPDSASFVTYRQLLILLILMFKISVVS
jgi:ABC-type uncharacterized transport system auxiliary subunit